MTATLRQLEIFELRPLIKNVNCKLSAISPYDSHKQILCIVSEDNEIVLRYIASSIDQEVLKMISWFRRTNRVIHDVSFDPAGVWLLVLCFDNTLHIVPALAIVDKGNLVTSYPLYSTTHVTSYIIPFVGPHECPNSKRCPNYTIAQPVKAECLVEHSHIKLVDNVETRNTLVSDENDSHPLPAELSEKLKLSSEPSSLSHELPAHMIVQSNEAPFDQHPAVPTESNEMMSTSFMASKTCPYPLSVVWWKTYDGANRAIIGYSDGSICFVGLSPNCPFVASTAIACGSVLKLLTCKDNTLESVMLLITSSMKKQYKLLLEQKAIMYIFPGDISPATNTHNLGGEWQIVMPLHGGRGSSVRKSNSSDPASDSSQLDEDVFIQSDEIHLSPNPTIPCIEQPSSISNGNQMTLPSPPPYSAVVVRNSGSYNPHGCLRFQEQQHTASSHDTDTGILPTARARLASLKSLGSKKLQAIKMRLVDNRQRVDEYLPEASLGSFAILDSPSVTPEPLGDTKDSFYKIQNLRSTYLLSALHPHSQSLTVHSIDINLKPLFLYKIPKNSVDLIICSNLLYAIQDVSFNNITSVNTNTNTASSLDEMINCEKKFHNSDIKKLHGVSLTENDVNQPTGSQQTQEIQNNTSNTNRNRMISTDSKEKIDMCSNVINAVGVISSAMASLRTHEDDEFNISSQLGLFRFQHETVLHLYQMATYRNGNLNCKLLTKEEKAKAFDFKDIHTPIDYVKFYENENEQSEYSLKQVGIMQNEFPCINYDPCYVVTNNNVYCIQLKKEPFAIFLEAALASEWTQCRDFCNTFDLSYETCIEFAGDYLLRRKKVTQALLTYNVARVKPIRTALKLAMYGHNYALMQLCAMALKATYVLRSRHIWHPIVRDILEDVTYRHSEDIRDILQLNSSERSKIPCNSGTPCSDYKYGVDESLSALQMSPSSQFHLANLLLITLAEKAVNDKYYIPLWNFLVTNSKYHTNMTSIVLCQSGLFSSALVLAKTRGVCIDIFLALTSVVSQEFGWYSELNVCLYNLSEEIFTESITYLPLVSVDYFVFIQEKIDRIRPCVLSRLAQQLNPFSPVLRPIVSHTSAFRQQLQMRQRMNDNNSFMFGFCKNLIETYLTVLIHMESQQIKHGYIINALCNFRINYEDNQFAIDSRRFKLISAGCAHCACVVDGVAYFWGSNGIPCCYSANKFSDPPEPPHAVKALELLSSLNLEVHAVKCGRQHSLILTNNGLYGMGNNNLYQLGIGRHMQMAMQPTLVRHLDGKNITILEAGQYHNAAVADGQLYTWGWGVYGQLGHGSCENVVEPRLVNFFKYKKVLQVSLGHAHSLVLCQAIDVLEDNKTDLYVFGSNHFGQLGIGGGSDVTCNSSSRLGEDALNCYKEVKCILPVKLEFSTSRLRLIHTKFFTNLAVDENERMFTWGSSPQALRLANQIRRRASAKQKLEESQHREMTKCFEATMSTVDAQNSASSSCFVERSTTYAAVAAGAMKASQIDDQKGQRLAVPIKGETSQQIFGKNTGACKKNDKSIASYSVLSSIEDEDVSKSFSDTKDLTSLLNHENKAIISDKDSRIDVSKLKTKAPLIPLPTNFPAPEITPGEHMTPHLVDTSEVAGNILQISSGLFHFALISSSCTLYTWGKNLEHQLGTEDKERKPVCKPSPIDSIDRPMYVDCGADFTIVMTVDFVVKAFGGNSNGQCGRDLGASLDRMKQRVVCLPTTKRLMRFESQCVEAPVEINLPRPRIRMNVEPVRYLKCIPRYQPHYMQEANINFEQNCYKRSSIVSPNYESSSENAITGPESEDIISSLENLSNNDGSSFNYSTNNAPLATDIISSFDCTPEEHSYGPLAEHSPCAQQSQNNLQNEDNGKNIYRPNGDDISIQPLRHYIHYCLYAFHGLYNPDKISKQHNEYRIRTLMLNFKFVDAFKLCLEDCDNAQRSLKIFEYFSKDTGYVPLRRQELKYLIYHLCTHFLDKKFDIGESERFFLADLDYYLLEIAFVLYFHNNNSLLEQNFNQKFKNLFEQEHDTHEQLLSISTSNQQDLSGTSTALASETNQSFYKLRDTDAIFDAFSVNFKTIVCQRLLKYYDN